MLLCLIILIGIVTDLHRLYLNKFDGQVEKDNLYYPTPLSFTSTLSHEDNIIIHESHLVPISIIKKGSMKGFISGLLQFFQYLEEKSKD